MQIERLVNQNVPSLRPNEPIVDAIKTLTESRLSALPVVSAVGELVGVLRTRDVLPILLGRSTRGRQVGHFMARRFVTFHPDDSVAEACNHWTTGGSTEELIVVDGDRFVGMLEMRPILDLIPKLRRAA